MQNRYCNVFNESSLGLNYVKRRGALYENIIKMYFICMRTDPTKADYRSPIIKASEKYIYMFIFIWC